MLDLVLTVGKTGSVSVCSDVEPFIYLFADPYHPPLEVTLSLPRGAGNTPAPSVPPASNHSYAPAWDFRKANFNALYFSLTTINWNDVLCEQDVDSATDLFYSKLNEVISNHVPVRKIRLSQARRLYPPWYTPEIISKLKIKYFHLRKFKEKGLQFNREVFKYYRSVIKNLIDDAYRQYTNLIVSNICRDPTQFWKHVRDRKRSRTHIGKYTFNGKEVEGQEAATIFAEYFSSVFLSEVPTLDAERAQCAGCAWDTRSVSLVSVTLDDVRRAVRRLKPSSAAGPDGVPPFLVKDCLSALEEPLLHLYNLSLYTCRYPERWKISKVTPVPKISSSTDVTTFRPIAVLNVLSKVFESIINFYLTRQIEVSLSDKQHGFRVARSTTTNHICFVDYVTAQMDAGRQVDAVFLDFRRAFDVVDNDILLAKLSSLGITPKLLKFFAHYFKDRRQYVQLKMYRSDEFYTRSGVSQGSTLGPTLFLAMINDLPQILNTAQCLMFADDLKVYQSVDQVSESVELQLDIESVVGWSLLNRLAFNVSKCKVITFSRLQLPLMSSYTLAGAALERVSEIRDLGLIMDSRLDFREHVKSLCKSANRTLGFIMRTAAQFRDVRVAIMLYNVFVRSKLEYSSIVWDPCEAKYTMMLERIQRKFCRYVYKRMYGYYPYLFPSLFVSGMIGVDTLELRRKLQLAIHYILLLHNKVNNPGILGAMGLYVPNNYVRTGRRRHRLFDGTALRTRHANNAPTIRALTLINIFVHEFQHIDVFYDSIRTLVIALHVFLGTSLR